MADFDIEIGNREELNKRKIRPMLTEDNHINCFTDGSQIEGHSGAAYIIFNNGDNGNHHIEKGFIDLGTNTTVFQTEITAITTATMKLCTRRRNYCQNHQLLHRQPKCHKGTPRIPNYCKKSWRM